MKTSHYKSVTLHWARNALQGQTLWLIGPILKLRKNKVL
jgi:hypothetical protein